MTNDTTRAGSLLWMAAAWAAVSLGPGCKKATTAVTDAGEAGPTAPVAEVEAAAAPLASNEVDVIRYADEKPTPGSALTNESQADLRTEVGTGGKLVVVVKKGTEVSKLAEHSGHYLVVAEDPKDPSRKLMGWASDAAFGGGGGGFHGSLAGGSVHAGDGGADGGKVAAIDAGGSAAGGAGGGAAPAGGGSYSCVKQQAGKCTAPYVVSGALCRLPCKAPSDCKGPDPKCNSGLCYASNGCGQ